ncbi:MAG: DUF1851 domain-containing protein [Hassallia sp. WJT32-NPBG1]|jgi:hypothetical protein|nr:DUF1851 domain-containing protein [Hassallia sp. WJT32-NPBG1]
MVQFPEFKKRHGAAIKCKQVDSKSIDLYKDKLPAALIEDWQETGWCGYSEGLIWTVNPSEFKSALSNWIEAADEAIVFARTAFGDMIVWNGQNVQYVSVLYNRVFELTKDIEILFEYLLCDNDYLKDALDIRLYRKALKKLGQLEPAECYGFEPAISLGGSGTVDTLQKVKLQEYLEILAQLSV